MIDTELSFRSPTHGPLIIMYTREVFFPDRYSTNIYAVFRDEEGSAEDTEVPLSDLPSDQITTIKDKIEQQYEP